MKKKELYSNLVNVYSQLIDFVYDSTLTDEELEELADILDSITELVPVKYFSDYLDRSSNHGSC